MMQALFFDQPSNVLEVRSLPIPEIKHGEALIQVSLGGICSTDIEITRGYVPGYSQVLGHEFVGVVSACDTEPSLIGKRVVGEINCNDAHFTCSDAIYQRNHAEGRSVLGIINRDGCLGQYVALPVSNLHVVPDGLSDSAACFCEPLAAACRIIEQGLLLPGSEVCVLGDGKLGLVCAQVLASHSAEKGARVTLIGRHQDKLSLVSGLHESYVVPSNGSIPGHLKSKFGLVVEATGSSTGIISALALARPMGQLVLKTTVSSSWATGSSSPVQWSDLCNDIVVNEKTLVGSRCGPMDVALRMMDEKAELKALLSAMVHSRQFSIQEGVDAMKKASDRGTMKVQVKMWE
jgi:threonine dehydrogenase-like Zn-dependent dehydrogenase